MIDNSNQNKVWQEIKINENKFILLVITEKNIWKVFLTNLVEIWTETLTEESIAQRCQELNPLLCIEEFDYKTNVTNILSDIANQEVEATVNEIQFKSIVGGGIFKFSIKLIKGTPQELWENITKPLCLSSVELIRRHKFLVDLIKMKDEEISEYKAEGAELIRKNIETKTFNESQFKTQMPTTDSATYVDAFQSVMQFCNSVNITQQTVKNESETSSTNSSSTERKRYDNSEGDDNCKRNKKSSSKSKSNIKPRKHTPQSAKIHPATSHIKKIKKRMIV